VRKREEEGKVGRVEMRRCKGKRVGGLARVEQICLGGTGGWEEGYVREGWRGRVQTMLEYVQYVCMQVSRGSGHRTRDGGGIAMAGLKSLGSTRMDGIDHCLFCYCRDKTRLPRFLAADCSLKPKVAATAPPTVLSPSPSAVFTQRFSFFLFFLFFCPFPAAGQKKGERCVAALLQTLLRHSCSKRSGWVGMGVTALLLFHILYKYTRERKNSLTHQETSSRRGVEERSTVSK